MNKCISLICCGLAFIIFMCQCDDTEDFFLKANDRPQATFTLLENDITHLYDSIKWGAQYLYEQPITIRDGNQNLKAVRFSLTSGQGEVLSNGWQEKELQPAIMGGRDGIYAFSYLPRQLGYHEIQILALDELLEADTLTLSLQVFDNLPPTAHLSIAPLRIVNRYEYRIDGSGSHDQDERFGGHIVKYQFQINSTVIERYEPQFKYVFGTEQIVTISLRVQDNNGTWSPKTEGVFNVD